MEARSFQTTGNTTEYFLDSTQEKKEYDNMQKIKYIKHMTKLLETYFCGKYTKDEVKNLVLDYITLIRLREGKTPDIDKINFATLNKISEKLLSKLTKIYYHLPLNVDIDELLKVLVQEQ